ncbi:putative lysine methyltransferase [Lyophyllum shimeji]|uniref:Lysine methyltransferase n=1 Tax=Lyophyllum shimeji TaxID=47721 RepID=A0A9P3UR63_LYOSH|nr:putative lysine methyltransferase [Lyophyllum shimeji]
MMNLNIDDDVRDAEDILNESLAFLGGQPVIDDSVVNYGPLSLQIAPKEGKANTLLADHLFSPALYLAERIERGLLPVRNSTVIELGAGTGLPSLLMASIPQHPSLVVVTDYPDEHILGNLRKNVDHNRRSFQPGCNVQCAGFEWGTDAGPLLKMLPAEDESNRGYDVMILSDLLHFHASHDVLIASIESLLRRSKDARVHVSAGKYTHRNVCDEFLLKGQVAGLSFEEIDGSVEEVGWKGTMTVAGLDKDSLAIATRFIRRGIPTWVGKQGCHSRR